MGRKVWFYVESDADAANLAAASAAAQVWQVLTGAQVEPQALMQTDTAPMAVTLHQGQESEWRLEQIDKAVYESWQAARVTEAKAMTKGRKGAGAVIDAVASASESSASADLDVPLVVFAADGASLALPHMGKMKPLHLDFELLSYRQRLLRGGRSKEPVARAVMQGLQPRQGERLAVFDATAGLGRESMILAHAGAQVYAFERQLPIWMILCDALNRAARSRFFPFPLPQLQPLGTIKDFAAYGLTAPDVIYYDPMFPERDSSAQVKKEMVLFKQLIGADQDSLDFLATAVGIATQRVVVKRPHDAEPLALLEQGIERSHFIDGGMCRFDCYLGQGANGTA